MYNHRTMTESAVLELRKAILRGDYPPGTRLVPAKLESEFRLSKTAIREAIRELAGTNLVVSKTHKGACVAESLHINEIKDIFDLRYQLEGKAAFLGAKHISPEDIQQMESLLEKMSKPQDRRRYADFLINQQFHLILYRASGWKYLTEVINRLFDQVLLFRSSIYRRATEQELETILSWDHFKAYHQDHVEIMKRINVGDSEGTRAAVVKNLKRGFKGLEELLAYFDNRNGN